MAVKAYEPREGVTGLVVEVQLGGGESLSSWAMRTIRGPTQPAILREQDFLDASRRSSNHP